MAAEGKPPAKGGSGDREVGYGKPPKHTRFQPGQSGNPRGRPKGTRNLKADLLEELGEKILIREGERARQVSKQRAVVKTLVTRTLKGDARAANTLLSMMMRLLDTGEGAPEEVEDLHPDELEILEAYKKRLAKSDEKEPAAPTRRRRRHEERESGGPRRPAAQRPRRIHPTLLPDGGAWAEVPFELAHRSHGLPPRALPPAGDSQAAHHGPPAEPEVDHGLRGLPGLRAGPGSEVADRVCVVLAGSGGEARSRLPDRARERVVSAPLPQHADRSPQEHGGRDPDDRPRLPAKHLGRGHPHGPRRQSDPDR